MRKRRSSRRTSRRGGLRANHLFPPHFFFPPEPMPADPKEHALAALRDQKRGTDEVLAAISDSSPNRGKSILYWLKSAFVDAHEANQVLGRHRELVNDPDIMAASEAAERSGERAWTEVAKILSRT